MAGVMLDGARPARLGGEATWQVLQIPRVSRRQLGVRGCRRLRRRAPAAGTVLALLLGAALTAAATVTGLAACGPLSATSTSVICSITVATDAADLRYAEHEELRRAHEAADAELTGVVLFTPFVAEEAVEESDLVIVEGIVTRVDRPRDGEDHFANDYVVFHVEPDRVLKGSPRFVTPVAFALLRGLDPPDKWQAVLEGDRVLVLSGRWDESLVTGPSRSGAYFPWNDYWGLFLKVEDEYVNVMAPKVSTTAEEVAAIVGPPNTTTTRGPGQVFFEDTTWRFEELARKEQALRTALTAGAAEQYRTTPDQVAMFWFGGFGYVMTADEHREQLWRLGQLAETGAALR